MLSFQFIVSFAMQKLFNKAQFAYSTLSRIFFPIFYTSSYTGFGLAFKYLIHFKLIFVNGIRQGSSFILLHVDISLPNTMYCVLSPWSVLGDTVKNLLDQKCWGLCLSSLFCYTYLCLFLGQYHIILITTALK